MVKYDFIIFHVFPGSLSHSEWQQTKGECMKVLSPTIENIYDLSRNQYFKEIIFPITFYNHGPLVAVNFLVARHAILCVFYKKSSL